jgi:hypothetical protein
MIYAILRGGFSHPRLKDTGRYSKINFGHKDLSRKTKEVKGNF